MTNFDLALGLRYRILDSKLLPTTNGCVETKVFAMIAQDTHDQYTVLFEPRSTFAFEITSKHTAVLWTLDPHTTQWTCHPDQILHSEQVERCANFISHHEIKQLCIKIFAKKYAIKLSEYPVDTSNRPLQDGYDYITPEACLYRVVRTPSVLGSLLLAYETTCVSEFSATVHNFVAVGRWKTWRRADGEFSLSLQAEDAPPLQSALELPKLKTLASAITTLRE